MKINPRAAVWLSILFRKSEESTTSWRTSSSSSLISVSVEVSSTWWRTRRWPTPSRDSVAFQFLIAAFIYLLSVVSQRDVRLLNGSVNAVVVFQVRTGSALLWSGTWWERTCSPWLWRELSSFSSPSSFSTGFASNPSESAHLDRFISSYVDQFAGKPVWAPCLCVCVCAGRSVSSPNWHLWVRRMRTWPERDRGSSTASDKETSWNFGSWRRCRFLSNLFFPPEPNTQSEAEWRW